MIKLRGLCRGHIFPVFKFKTLLTCILLVSGYSSPLSANEHLTKLEELHKNLDAAVKTGVSADIEKASKALAEARTKLATDLADARKLARNMDDKSDEDLSNATRALDDVRAAVEVECDIVDKALETQHAGVKKDGISDDREAAIGALSIERKNLDCDNLGAVQKKKRPPFKEVGYSTRNFFMSTGLATLAPFTIKENGSGQFIIDDDQTDVEVNPFVEFRYRRRLAWEEARDIGDSIPEALGFLGRWKWGSEPGFLKSIPGFLSGFAPYDLDFRLGFTFNSDGNETSGSAVIGSSNLNARMGFGWPLYVGKGSGNQIYTSGLEFLYESITDRQAQDAHNRLAVGINFSAGWEDTPLSFSMKDGESLKPRVYEYAFRVTANRMEKPDLVTLNKTQLQIENKRGFPDFENTQLDSTVGIEGEFQIPFGKTGYFLIDGGIFNGDVDPNPWYLRIGLTVPLQGLFGIIASPISETVSQ